MISLLDLLIAAGRVNLHREATVVVGDAGLHAQVALEFFFEF